jgi:hypothetical protein
VQLRLPNGKPSDNRGNCNSTNVGTLSTEYGNEHDLWGISPPPSGERLANISVVLQMAKNPVYSQINAIVGVDYISFSVFYES